MATPESVAPLPVTVGDAALKMAGAVPERAPAGGRHTQLMPGRTCAERLDRCVADSGASRRDIVSH